VIVAKRYELSNHLGSVLTTVSDQKIPVDNNSDNIVDFYLADVTSATDYYSGGFNMPGRSFNPTEYRYGNNTQEKDNEIFNGAYTALFWEYDSRTLRRWNRDQVPKAWLSSYACFTNNPIWKTDPLGDDDFFNSEGKITLSTKTGSVIHVQNAQGNYVKLSQMPMNNMESRQVVAKIAAFYAGLIGVTGTVGVSNYPGGKVGESVAFYSPFLKGIFLDARSEPAGLSPLLDDINNLKSTIEHEDSHKQSGLGGKKDPLGHVQVYQNQIQGKFFDNTTSDFKGLVSGNIAKYLTEEAKAITDVGNGDFAQLDSKITEVNKLSGKTGYTFSRIYTGSGSMGPEGQSYEVIATKNAPPAPVKNTPKKKSGG